MTAAPAAVAVTATMASGSSGMAVARLLSRSFLCESSRDSLFQASASSWPRQTQHPGPGRGWALWGRTSVGAWEARECGPKPGTTWGGSGFAGLVGWDMTWAGVLSGVAEPRFGCGSPVDLGACSAPPR